MKGYDKKFIVQGIHMLFNGEVCDEWNVEESKRQSKLVFIGLDLPHQLIKNEFKNCIFLTPEEEARVAIPPSTNLNNSKNLSD